MRYLALVEVVSRANADVMVVLAHVCTKLWEQVTCCAAAPGKGVDDSQNPKVVDEEESRRNYLALLGAIELVVGLAVVFGSWRPFGWLAWAVLVVPEAAAIYWRCRTFGSLSWMLKRNTSAYLKRGD